MEYLFDSDIDFFDGRARWIWSEEGVWGPSPDPRPIQCRYFARRVTVDAGQRLILAISADTRYMLYVNGRIVARGPQKGDVSHQFFDVLDIGDELAVGENLLLVRVDSNARAFPRSLHTGPAASEMSAATVFVADAALVDADGREAGRIVSDESWRVKIDPALSFHESERPSFTGFKEDLDFSRLPRDFHAGADLDDGTWKPATVVSVAFRPDTVADPQVPHMLIPRFIAPLTLRPHAFAAVRELRSGRIMPVINDEGAVECEVAANSRMVCILDAGQLRTAYPELDMRGGQGARLRLKYAECLQKDGKKERRDQVAGLDVRGYSDWITVGNGHASWSPMHWRTFRYIELSVETKAEPLRIASLSMRDCHYPLFPAEDFRSDDQGLEAIWRVGLRTQQACAHDTYEDCPYYEQLQYAGDTQAQMLFTYAMCGDTRLPRQAIRFFHWSQTSEGLTQSRYPSRPTQIIPFWSLHYLFMLHDWYMHTGDVKAIRSEILDAPRVLRWFLDLRNADGLIDKLPYWCCADWSPDWQGRFGNLVPGVKEGPTALTHFMTIAALEQVADLHDLLDEAATAESLRRQASALRPKAQDAFWDARRGVYKDSVLHTVASQLTNAWAILIGMVDGADREALAAALDADKQLCQAAFFGQFYLFEAWRRTLRQDLVVKRFEPYRRLIDLGFTTWPEFVSLGTRSDCHAWSNAATYHLLRSVLGFSILEPGCRRLEVRPHLDGLRRASGSFVTPHGPVRLAFDADAGPDPKAFAITVPDKVAVDLHWRGKMHHLLAGTHELDG